MTLRDEIKHRAKSIIPQAFAAAMVIYFAYHALHGERGLYAYLQVSQDLEEAEQKQKDILSQKNILQKRVQALRPEALDLDMLDERARSVLNYGRSDELVIFLPEE